jgi:hypothetical protein
VNPAPMRCQRFATSHPVTTNRIVHVTLIKSCVFFPCSVSFGWSRIRLFLTAGSQISLVLNSLCADSCHIKRSCLPTKNCLQTGNKFFSLCSWRAWRAGCVLKSFSGTSRTPFPRLMAPQPPTKHPPMTSRRPPRPSPSSRRLCTPRPPKRAPRALTTPTAALSSSHHPCAARSSTSTPQQARRPSAAPGTVPSAAAPVATAPAAYPVPHPAVPGCDPCPL